jgi:hypothetical protein
MTISKKAAKRDLPVNGPRIARKAPRWVHDPGDRCEAVEIHSHACGSRYGEACSCTPEVVLIPSLGSDRLPPLDDGDPL